MIHAIRKLARTIHRRSIWQVVGVYAAVAWAAVAGSGWLTNLLGLPSWTPTMTLVLVLVLFPLVVATAVVQGGIPGLRIEDAADPNELVGLTPDEVHVVPEAHPLYGVGLFTWRNTALGAVASCTLLVATVVAYLTMWALGIGPVGSLLAQGVIVVGEPVFVVTFANGTDDPSLGALVSDVVELDLSASGVVTVLAGDDPPNGARLLIDGEVTPYGEGHAVSARIGLAEGGVALARFEEVTSGDSDLLDAIELLSERIREKLGEPLRSIRRSPRLASLRTESVEALRLFGLASRATGTGDHLSAVELLEQALGIDDGFVLAWRTLGAAHEQRADTTGAVDAYRRAVDLWSEQDRGRRTVRELRARIAQLGG